MLRITGLGKIYRRPEGKPVQALEGVSLTVGDSEFVAVQGPSGCGKTTLLLASGGLLLPSQGKVELDGVELYGIPPDDRARLRARDIGFVFQQFYLIPYLSVLENILAPSLAFAADRTEERARELIDRLRLTERSDHFPAELSTGERQRTAMARALMNRPSLLLADEPTGNLDPENSEILLGYLAEFSREGGAVLMVTHSGTAAGHARRKLLLDKGRLLETPKD